MGVSQVEIEPVLASRRSGRTPGRRAVERRFYRSVPGCRARDGDAPPERRRFGAACAAIILVGAMVAPATCAAASALGSRAKRRCSNAS